MGWLNNRIMRGASNRAGQLLASEFGAGLATRTLALALGHACYPTATYGDKNVQDEIVKRLTRFVPQPCDSKTACQHVEAWLDKGTLSTAAVFHNAWGMGPDQLLERFFEEAAEEPQ